MTAPRFAHKVIVPVLETQVDAGAAIREMIERDLWGIVLTVAQKHGFQPRTMFDMEEVTYDARSEAWALLVAGGATAIEVTRWWNSTLQRVARSITGHTSRYPLAFAADEKKPGMIKGAGDRREDCEQYEECLTAACKREGQSRCPSACNGYVAVPLRIEDFMHQKREGESDKFAAPRQVAGSGR